MAEKKKTENSVDMKKKSSKKKEAERGEALMRIVVGIVSGIILYVWMYLDGVFIVINIIYTLIKGNKSDEVSGLCEVFNSQLYDYCRYMGFVSSKRPFPFEKLQANISKVE